MRLKHFLTGFVAGLVLLTLVGIVTAATLDLENRASAAAKGGSDQTDANITRVTTSLLEHSQFSQHRLDDEMAAKFLDDYLDALDPDHMLFLQSDIQEFDGFRPELADMTRREGDLAPERIIFQRYLERLDQRSAYVTNLLQTGKFDFTGHDVYSFDRKQTPRPANLAAARELWRENVRAEYLQEKLTGTQPTNIVATLTRRYTRLAETMKNLSSEDVLQVYLDTLAHVYDPHSDYFGHEAMDDFSIAMNLSLFGIGATLQADDGYCKISDLVPGGPAARSGLLKVGDRIVAVAQGNQKPVDIVDMPLPDAVKLIRGSKGTRVRLTLIPAGAADAASRKTITLVRDEVKLADQRAKASIVDWPRTNGPALRLGVIDLPAFYGGFDQSGAKSSSASADVAKLIRKLEAEHIQGLVLDLRHNGGGSLAEAIRLTGLFIHEGPVVQTREPDGQVDVDSDTDASELYDGPLIVLTSRFSASASEILAGALQDYGRALIVGDKSTFGKGTVQTVVPLARLMDRNHLEYSFDPGDVKVTIQKFYRPSGASTQLKGVTADIALPSLSDVSGVGEAEMQDPLPWDRIPSSDFTPEDHVSPFLQALRAQSAARVAHDQDFADLHEDIAQFQKNLATKSVSLNEAERRREDAADKAREAARKAELAARKEIEPVTYDITVANAGDPGLPAPVVTTNAPVAKASASKTGEAEDAVAGTPPEDTILREAEHIMADYVALVRQTQPVGVARR